MAPPRAFTDADEQHAQRQMRADVPEMSEPPIPEILEAPKRAPVS